MGESFLQRVNREVLVMSGAMGTMLHQSGADLSGCTGEWILDHPEPFRALIEDYFDAGCDIVSATTFTLSRIGLEKYGLAHKVKELNRGVVAIVKEMQRPGTFVTASVGPTGKLLKPLGELTPEELFDVYSEQASLLASAGADLITVLTMYDLEEAVIACRAAKKSTSLPVIVSLAYDPAPRGFRTMMGVSPEAAAERLEAEGADVIGANCGSVKVEQMAELVGLMRGRCSKPIMAKPNAGSPKVSGGKEQYATGPEAFAGQVSDWIRAGAKIVSACCGSGPEHIRRIVAEVKRLAS